MNGRQWPTPNKLLSSCWIILIWNNCKIKICISLKVILECLKLVLEGCGIWIVPKVNGLSLIISWLYIYIYILIFFFFSLHYGNIFNFKWAVRICFHRVLEYIDIIDVETHYFQIITSCCLVDLIQSSSKSLRNHQFQWDCIMLCACILSKCWRNKQVRYGLVLSNRDWKMDSYFWYRDFITNITVNCTF